MAGGRKGLVAPQNTFLENIVRRSNGKRCIRICYPCFLSVPLLQTPPAARRQQMQQNPGALLGAAARALGAASRRLGEVGRAGRGLMGPHPKRRALLGSLFGPFSRLLGLIFRECDS